LFVGPKYRQDSPYSKGIEQLENFFLTHWPEAVTAVSEAQIKIDSLILNLPVVSDEEEAKEIKKIISRFFSDAALQQVLAGPSQKIRKNKLFLNIKLKF
jgi:hypothetical protein